MCLMREHRGTWFSHPRGSPCRGIACPRDLFQSREAGALGRALSKTHFILESILSTAWKAASLLCAHPFLSNRECLSASKHLIKKAASLFKPFYFVWDGCLSLSLCSPPCRLRFRLQLTKKQPLINHLLGIQNALVKANVHVLLGNA